MSETMTVYFASQTGHVFGAVTRAAGTIPTPPRAPSLEDVLVLNVGPEKDAELLVPAADLSTLVLLPNPDLLLQHLAFQVSVQIDNVERLPPNATVSGVVLASTQVEVSVSASVAQDAAVWVLITGPTLPTPRVAVGVIKQGKLKTDPPLLLQRLDPGTYRVLALVRGHPPVARSERIP